MFNEDGLLANHNADTIKAALEHIHARLSKLEKAKGKAAPAKEGDAQ